MASVEQPCRYVPEMAGKVDLHTLLEIVRQFLVLAPVVLGKD
jgi:hypothetical protein